MIKKGKKRMNYEVFQDTRTYNKLHFENEVLKRTRIKKV